MSGARIAVPNSAMRSASAGGGGTGFGAARGGSAFGKTSQLTQATNMAKQAPLANATAKPSAATSVCNPITGTTVTQTRMNSGASFDAPFASAYSARNTMSALAPKRICGTPRNA